MTIAVWAVVLMLFGHWVADFVFQPHWMGMRKSKEWWVLTQHALRITAGGLATALVIGLFYPISLTGAIIWAALNGLAHFGIDAVTSRITGRFYAKGDMHHFFSTIGFDQFLHMAFAVLTLAWLIL
jgi:hypothetical protein